MNKGVVVDLDGTLLATNTFKEYIIFSFQEAIKLGYYSDAFKSILFIILRKCRIIKHTTMKYYILNSTNTFIDKCLITLFVGNLLSKINNKVLSILKEYKKEKYIICLSTAAPEIYVNEIFYHLRQVIDIVCCTPNPSRKEKWFENSKNKKCSNTLELLNNKNAILNIFLTDHFDDIPLLLIEKDLNTLVDPSLKTINKLKALDIKYTML